MPIKLIEVSDLLKSYRMDGRTVEVLRYVNFVVDAGEKVAIIGPSGAGKSTLLHQIGLLETPTSGSISIRGVNTSSLNESERTAMRLNEIGFIFQFHHLMGEFTALENVIIPGMITGKRRKACEPRALHLLDQVGLSGRVNHKPGELSGGEQQRVALARALMNNPAIILADEPTGNLDRDASEMMKNVLWTVCKTEDTALILVTHNHALAGDTDQVYQMTDGTVEPIQVVRSEI